jgi:REP element-mobilizing transposase RayT
MIAHDEGDARHAYDESSSRGAEQPAHPTHIERAWYHVTFSTYGTWLRGDERGFRDHDHRTHSSGNYKDPPPITEHTPLREWCKRVMHKDPVHLSHAQRVRILPLFLDSLRAHNVRPIALALLPDHVHLLANFECECVRKHIGVAKTRTSHALRNEIPGTVWAKKCFPKLIRDREHHSSTFGYIVRHEKEGGVVWTFRDERAQSS